MLVLLRLGVLSGVSGFPVASPCLWGKLQKKIATKVVMLFCVAGVALCDIPTSLGCLARNARFASPTCLVSSLWFSCGLAVPMGEAAKPLLFEGCHEGCHVVLRGRRGTLGHSSLFYTVSKVTKLEEVSHEMLVLMPLHTPHSTLYTLHFTLYTPHFTNSTLLTLHFNYTPHFTLRTRHSTLYTLTHSPTHSLTH